MKLIKLTLNFGKCVNVGLGLMLQYANKKMSTKILEAHILMKYLRKEVVYLQNHRHIQI